MKSIFAIFILLISLSTFAQDGANERNPHQEKIDLMFDLAMLKQVDSTRVEPYYTLQLIKLTNDIEILDLEINYGIDSEEYKAGVEKFKLELEKEHKKYFK